MAGWDEGNVFYANPAVDTDNQAPTESAQLAQRKFAEFVRAFRDEKDGSVGQSAFKYSDALLADKKRLKVDLQDIQSFNGELAQALRENPAYYLPLLERAATEELQSHHNLTDDGEPQDFSDLQVMLHSSVQFEPRTLRDLTSKHVAQLVQIPGIVTSASRPKHKATIIRIMCKDCKNTRDVPCKPGLGGAMLPRFCDANAGVAGGGAGEGCSTDPFVVLPHKSTFVDQQTIKLQERPEDVPTGELPRSLTCTLDRHLCGKISPGTRITAVGIYSILQGKSDAKSKDAAKAVAIKQPYLRIVGIEENAEEASQRLTFTAEEEAEFKEYAARPDVTEDLFSRIAPQIFGHEFIKQAIACLLFGGSRKKMPDGTYRRGDINVLLIGDPSTAKSQFLKFASKTAPIAVYTSGKGSSAAGLTATVIKDAHGEFYLEGGAMVLADNGVVCIDEFDKMRAEDRVAIHEAMEQQTISIAKAGITTMLKSRTSVLAAANPPSGRYDDLKSAQENIDLQTTILSRFDLIFIVKDERLAARDMQIARHVLDVHRLAGAQAQEPDEEQVKDEAFLKRYLQYARAKCAPRLTDDAARALGHEYVELREEVRKVARGESGDMPAVPITVRQLEAIVRIAESLARMQLQTSATLAHVRKAIDMFKVSTMDAVRSGVMEAVTFTEEARAELHSVEAQIRRRIAIGSYVSERKLVDELVRVGLSENLVRKALMYMVSQNELEHRKERRLIHRLK